MRRVLLIGVPALVVILAVSMLGKATTDSKYPIGPLAPFVTRQQTFVMLDQPASLGPTIQVWVWLEGDATKKSLPAYRDWLQNEAHWNIHHSSASSLGATNGKDVVPDAIVDLESNGSTCLLIYTRRLSSLEALVDGLIYGRKDFNSPMPTK